ncbi:MAG TPA: OsmC family protein [Polyangia bacterium]|nr:OsmC family protein [Polyangia bacterium]
MATATLDSKAGYAQTIEAGEHRLTADESEAAGGTNTGPAPYALLLASLGACTSITLRMYADRKSWALGEIHVSLRHRKTPEGADQIEREIRFGAPLTEEQRTRLGEIADKTPVTKTIRAGATIETRLV